MKTKLTKTTETQSQVSPSPRAAHQEMMVSAQGMRFKHYFTKEGVDPFDEIEYENRSSVITEPDGKVVFELHNIEVPKNWTQLATDILASKYFKRAGVPETGHEVTARQVVHRIAHSIRDFGEKYGYFASAHDAEAFEAELKHLMITQKGAFNSPVWFNCGLYQAYGIEGSGGASYFDMETSTVKETDNGYEHPQCSACFIQSVEDDLMAIFDLVKNEAKLFKFGSGTGTNFSKLRGRQEKLSGGGTSSGLMSFLEVLDKGAGATKSGGTTRRAAKMVCLDMDHPEIEDFINWKVKEERKAKALIDAGYPSDFNGEAYKTISGQNSNNSVRIPDSFMEAYTHDGDWQTIGRTTGKVVEEFKARDLMDQIARAAWECADPGIQFDDTINRWHTCSNTDKIYGSNPCSEYMFLDDTACNLASLNLMKFRREDGSFDTEAYRYANRVFFTAQEILVDFSSYPTAQIAENSHKYRPLGLGYANLGTLLMTMGIAYDSDEGRAIAAAITAIMHGEGFRTSAELASVKGAFEAYQMNAQPMMKVMNMHRDHVYSIDKEECPEYLLEAAKNVWDDVIVFGQAYGYRNAQATVLAPTGTIGLLMDCDTTGVEPEFALVKFKKLAGGGYFKIINQSIPTALRHMGYSEGQIVDMIDYVLGKGTFLGATYADPTELKKLGFSDADIDEAEAAVAKSKSFNEWTPKINPTLLKEKGLTDAQVKQVTSYIAGTQTMEGAPHLKEEHVSVFDCANKCGDGERFIRPHGHIYMMGAVQPFLSGAISKTINLPNEATVEEIKALYVDSWQLGLKAVALYRDGCKSSQPLNSGDGSAKVIADVVHGPKRGEKVPMPAKRAGLTVEASIGGQKVYVRTGEYADGALGEVFIDMFKEGASYRSLLNCFAVSVSVGLQYGVPLEKFVDAFTFTRFEPSGMVNHPNIKTCTSVVDYIFRMLGMEYLGRTDFVHVKPEEIRREDNHKVSKIKNAISVEQEASVKTEQVQAAQVHHDELDAQLGSMMGDAPACNICGHITVRNGSCYRCLSCGNSMGCS